MRLQVASTSEQNAGERLVKPNYDVIHSRDFYSHDIRLKIKVRKKDFLSVQNLEL